MRNSFRLTCLAGLLGALLLPVGCKKDNSSQSKKTPAAIDDALYLSDALMRPDEESGEQVPYFGALLEDGTAIHIPVASYGEAEAHFRSLTHPGAQVENIGGQVVWHMTDQKNVTQGDAILKRSGDGLVLAELSLPESCAPLEKVVYKSINTFLLSLNPDVMEDLEDNYYYGAIVEISDHGCGSGKFVVIREYNTANGAAGMAVRLMPTRYHISKNSDQESAINRRSSCLATLRTAGTILTGDNNILSKQLANAGAKSTWNDHFYSSDRQWTGLHYYYNLWDGETDTIGPFNDLEFYEAWIYYFVPDGDRLKFW